MYMSGKRIRPQLRSRRADVALRLREKSAGYLGERLRTVVTRCIRRYGLLLWVPAYILSASASHAAGSMKDAYIEIPDTLQAYQAFTQSVAERVLIPAFQTFKRQSAHLYLSSTQFCGGGRTAAQFAALENSWRMAMEAWMQTQPFRFGPAKDEFVDLKIQFWPDEKGLVKSKVEELLNSGQPLDANVIAAASAAAQGLPAMEYLMYGFGDGVSAFTDVNQGDRRCLYLVAAAENMRNQSRALTSAWGNSKQGYLPAFAYSNDSIDIGVSFATLLREALVALEFVKNTKVGKPFGLPQGTPNALFLESWRSGNSLNNIISNLITLQQIFYGGSHFGLDDLLVINYGETELEFNLRSQIAKCLSLASSLSQPLANQINNQDVRNQVETLFTELVKLIAYMKQDLARVLGITIGFSSNDGD